MSHEGNEATTSQPVDRKELLSQQFTEVETQVAAPVEIADPDDTKTAGDRARDEKGKFTAKEAVVETPAVEAAPVQAVEPPLWERPPASWKKEYHDFWKSADPKLKEYAWQREEQMRAGVEPLIPKAQLADQITKAAEPYMNTIRGMNIDLPTAVAGLMKADHDLRNLPPEQKLQRFLGLAQVYGINLNGVEAPQGHVDPVVFSLQNELLGMKGELANWKQLQEQREGQALQNEINSFAQSKEHFEIARPFMVDLLNKGVDGGGAASLEDAYEKVTGPGGVLHDLIASSKQAAAIPNQRVIADKAAKAARAAAVSVRSATPGSTGTTKAQDRRSMLSEQLDGLSERL